MPIPSGRGQVTAANLNIHLHCLVLEGVYRCGADGVPVFDEVDVPTDDELHALLQILITRSALSDERVQLNAAGQGQLMPGALERLCHCARRPGRTINWCG